MLWVETLIFPYSCRMLFTKFEPSLSMLDLLTHLNTSQQILLSKVVGVDILDPLSKFEFCIDNDRLVACRTRHFSMHTYLPLEHIRKYYISA